MKKVEFTTYDRIFLSDFITAVGRAQNTWDDVAHGVPLWRTLRFTDTERTALGLDGPQVAKEILDRTWEFEFERADLKWLCDRFLDPDIRGLPICQEILDLRQKMLAIQKEGESHDK